MEKVFVTGTNGFIASHLIPELIEKGYDVHSLSRFVTGRYIQKSDSDHNVIEGNLNDHDRIRDIIVELQPEYIVHLAAITPVSYSYDHPFEIFYTNFHATVNLAETCRKHDPDIKQFLFAGTSEEYGDQQFLPISEHAELRPNSPYSVSKVASDHYLKYMRDAYGFPITVARPFNTYGRVNNTHHVVERIASQMLDGETVNLGDSTATRDFLYVDDHVNAYLACMGNEKAAGETFNFCTGVGTSILELEKALAKITGFNGNVNWDTIPPRPLDIKVLVGDSSKAWYTLGWRAKTSLEDGLKKTIEKIDDETWLTARQI